MMEVIIRYRIMDYQAYVAGMVEVCGYGQSPDEAVGQMIRAHQYAFGIDLLEE